MENIISLVPVLPLDGLKSILTILLFLRNGVASMNAFFAFGWIEIHPYNIVVPTERGGFNECFFYLWMD
jgi:hypothetical protein